MERKAIILAVGKSGGLNSFNGVNNNIIVINVKLSNISFYIMPLL